jgi:hypothetical protein
MINLLFLKFWLWPLVDNCQSTYLPHTIAQIFKNPGAHSKCISGQFTLIRFGYPSPNLGLVLGIELNLLIGSRCEICLGMLFTSKIKHRISIFPFSPYL